MSFAWSGVLRLGQLIVGGTGYDIDLQRIERVIVDYGAQGTWREDVGVDPVDSVGPHRRRAEVGNHLPHLIVFDIRHAQAGSLLSESLTKMIPHMSKALNDDVSALERIIAVAGASASLDAPIDTDSGEGTPVRSQERHRKSRLAGPGPVPHGP